MMELVALAQPGPFAQRTFELGGYVGIFHDARLVAMAGQRISVPGYTEISAVCTHPDARRLGYAATVTAAVARNLLERGVTPILHVADVNVNALRVYERLGFTTRRLVNFTALRTPT
jgi:predicted GNAT family acetyltransferase